MVWTRTDKPRHEQWNPTRIIYRCFIMISASRTYKVTKHIYHKGVFYHCFYDGLDTPGQTEAWNMNLKMNDLPVFLQWFQQVGHTRSRNTFNITSYFTIIFTVVWACPDKPVFTAVFFTMTSASKKFNAFKNIDHSIELHHYFYCGLDMSG